MITVRNCGIVRWIIEKLLALVQLIHGSFNPGLTTVDNYGVYNWTGLILSQIMLICIAVVNTIFKNCSFQFGKYRA